MSFVDRWLLPDGVEDVLPPQAKKLEVVRRRLLDLFETWGYEYVIPPTVEFLESLLTGTGKDLDLKTFKVVDLVTGRMMGIRADITPQVARIDAHSLNGEGIARLCYAGTVVHSKADSMLASRTPISVGAELFGETSGRGDLEIVSLMVDALKSLGVDRVHVDLGDVAIFRQLVDGLALDADQQEQLFEAVQRKSVAEIRHRAETFDLTSGDINMLCELPDLTGDLKVLKRARDLFGNRPGIVECIDNLESVAEEMMRRFADLEVYFDLSELRGYAYHTGIVFSAFVDGSSQVVAKGGRYDHIGGVFGREGRGATGFSINLNNLADQLTLELPARQTVLARPQESKDMLSLWAEVQRLRDEGYVVVESGDEAGYDYVLVNEQGGWTLNPSK
ncbi:MAG: ATP phosphoribosyltransferase regulatory subunit [Proteobacteria bacterium]|nr:ATP phosphoribosyltransferase regulatory subunit [Pseudomonadota bacterium]